jgi:hypothetical protein
MKRLASIALLVAGVAGLWLAGAQHGPLLQMRREFHLNWEEPLENSPPLVSFTSVALGGFRGIMADLLWLRAAQLQQDKKYFELVQLADWITKLEPRFAMVWAFHGWNLAYNVSVLFDSPVDRWRWVKHGIELMRDEGLHYNPGDPRLHRELGWIFQHKMGANLDQANAHYKRSWAAEMGALFDGPRPDYAFCRAQPDDPRVVKMKRVHKLLPEVMERVDKENGPLDWRLPQAHAIYWAKRGKPYAKGFDAIQIDRMIFQSMQEAFWAGRLVSEPGEGVFVVAPNVEVLSKVRATYEYAVNAHPDESSIRSAYRNFLNGAVLVLYMNHYTSEARDTFEALRSRYPGGGAEQGFERYMYGAFTDRIADMSQAEATAMIEGLLFQSCFWTAIGETDRALGPEQVARFCWQRYMEKHRDPKEQERVGLRPFAELRRAAWNRALAAAKTQQSKARLEAVKDRGQ